MYEKNPLSPHLQIYGWQISSLLSITHRIIGVVNAIVITLICLWTISLLFGEQNYEVIKFFFQSFFGLLKLFAIKKKYKVPKKIRIN